MAEAKTRKTGASVDEFLNAVTDDMQRADAFHVLALMKDITGLKPKMWGPSIVGFGEYHYVYDSGHEGNCCMTGFSPRKGNLTLYFMAGLQERFAKQLTKLGKFKASVGCLYIKKLEDIDIDVLREMIEANVEYLKKTPPKSGRETMAEKKPAARAKSPRANAKK